MATVRKTTKKKTTARAARASSKASQSTRTAHKTTRPGKRGTGRRAASPNGKDAPGKKTKPLLTQKEMLQQERVQVEGELNRLRAEMQEAPDLTGDEVDLNIYEREKTLGLVATYERRLEEIDTTLKVAEKGKYGICERCGNPIDPERLMIFPETRLCVDCKNILEKEQRRLRK